MRDIQALCALVEENREAIFACQDYIWKHPQTGYREWAAHEYLKEAFERLGYAPHCAGDIPGFYADLDTGRPGPTVCAMGELDSLIVSGHPDADPQTGYVHACGHSAQCAMLLGLAAALKRPGALSGLSGRIRLMAVPAEELIEVGFRERLMEAGTIRYFGGKVEFMRRGYFEGVDMSLMIHTASLEGRKFVVNEGCNGCVTKQIEFEGVSAHAGGSPHEGVNALYAATAAISAVNALRETFRDEDHVRFHPIVTAGGQAVNAIPHRVCLESYVRGANMDCIRSVNRRINRALAASAAAFGANVVLRDRPGYSPLHNDPTLAQLAREELSQLVGAENVLGAGEWDTGCTDMGDVSCVMPALHPYVSGARGTGHGDDYAIADPDAACLGGAKALLLMVTRLLCGDAAEARRVVACARPLFGSQAEFLEAIDRLTLTKRAVSYREDGTVALDFE